MPPAPDPEVRPGPQLRVRRLGIDTHREAVVYLRHDSPACRSEGFEALARVELSHDGRRVLATLNVVTSELVALDEAGLSEAAWRALAAHEGDSISIAHPAPLLSLGHVRAKVHGRRLPRRAMAEIIGDVVAGRYSDVQLAALVTAFAGHRLGRAEMIGLTRSMIEAGNRLSWGVPMVVDKHCVGGLPGNRTTLIVVPIVAAHGLVMPKTSSRAITSPAGTADTMETLAPVRLDVATMRRVVEEEGACIAWGGAMHLSPADDILIRVERPLELDSHGQLVASVLSKKAAAGATHVVIDVPVGPTAKVRSEEAANELADDLRDVGAAVGLDVRVVITDGSQPVGHGIGPALEARDVLAVLRRDAGAPQDLRERALLLASHVLELSPSTPAGEGLAIATRLLDSGAALQRFERICEAQGGARVPAVAPLRRDIVATSAGIVRSVDNRRVARIAKLAGAPEARAAGLEVHVRIGDRIAAGQPLFTVHAETPGELDYALAHASVAGDLVTLVAQ